MKFAEVFERYEGILEDANQEVLANQNLRHVDKNAFWDLLSEIEIRREQRLQALFGLSGWDRNRFKDELNRHHMKTLDPGSYRTRVIVDPTDVVKRLHKMSNKLTQESKS